MPMTTFTKVVAIAMAALAASAIAIAARADPMKIRPTINGKALTATMIDNKTTRD